MDVTGINDRLPKHGQYVLAHLTLGNWNDPEDPDGTRYWRVLKFKRGISQTERSEMSDLNPRKGCYYPEDEQGNNERPYAFFEFGPNRFFGQQVDCWCELPNLEGLTGD